ncbi:IS3 family transposase, partial [Escherichia coli]|uniref:IS3 family transposase n=1 Tax=Escherichia coli TaxID=562 RepID=UPI0009071659
IAPSTYYHCQQQRHHPDKRSARAQHDDWLKREIQRVYDENHQVYGVRKVLRQLLREGIRVARCTVARLMAVMGLAGVLRGKWARRPSGTIHHSDKGSQYVSLAYTERLKEAGLLASTGSTGASYDNAMAESINGLYKAEVIHRKSWKTRAEVELATLTWVDWYNNRRLLGRLGHTPPAEAEKAYYASIGNDDLAA